MASPKSAFLLLTLLALVVMTLAWAIVPEPVLPESTPTPGETWRLPELPRQDQNAIFAKLRQLQPWGRSALAGDVASDESWTFVGCVREGLTDYALILGVENKVDRFGLEDSLPDGSVLTRIQNDLIEVVNQGEAKTLRLYEASHGNSPSAEPGASFSGLFKAGKPDR